MDILLSRHWDKAYLENQANQLGWFEEKSGPSLSLFQSLNLSKDAIILNVGCGNSVFTDEIIALGYNQVIATDISKVALKQLEKRIKPSTSVKFILDDITNPKDLHTIPLIDLWYDRAVLHFFTEEEQINTYFNLLKKKVKIGGYVILATFAKDIGYTKCSNLSVKRYDAEMMLEGLGNNFVHLNSLHYNYTNPSGGERPYVYGLFQKVSKN